MIYIIGSGPSSIAALAACVEKDIEITVLDIGFTADSSYRREGLKKKKSKIPTKTIFGSDYPYWDSMPRSFKRDNQTEALSSHAKGGFSNTWGAGIFPYSKEEFQDWPIPYDSMCKYYKRLDSFLPMATSKQDVLEKKFPFFHSNYTELKSSSQFQKIFKRYEMRKRTFISKGIYIGKSRLSIDQKEQNCSYCSKCIEGCPDHLIYSSSYSLEKFLKLKNVHYIKGIQVEKISKDGKRIMITGYDLINKKSVCYDAEKVYVGCGTLSTTQIMMRSLEVYDQEVEIKDSQYFIFPILGPSSKSILKEDIFTLSQAFCEINNNKLDANRIHLSLYGYSQFLDNYITKTLGIFGYIFRPIINIFLKRIYIAQGFIHSDNSNKIKLTMKKGEEDRITIKAVNTEKVRKSAIRIAKFSRRNLRSLGLLSFSWFLTTAPTGKSFHLGGSMPMKKNPLKDLETNILGETKKMPGVHIIDSSLFPNIPSGPITYTIMANAYRIVTESLKSLKE